MLLKIKFGPLALAILFFAIFAATFNGTLQEYVHFADPINELFFAVIMFCMAGMSFIASFEIVKQNKK